MGEGENHLQFFLTAQTSGGILLSVSTASGSDRLLVNSWSRPLSVFRRSDKRLDHFSIDEVAVELIQLRQPEVITRIVSVRAAVWIAPQVAKELH